jgi:hypothetical protein
MRRVFAAAAAVAACALGAASTAVAAPGLDGPTIPELAKYCPTGKTVVNISQTIANNADRGVRGNVWAFDGSTRQGGAPYTRMIVVLEVAPGLYCAATHDSGRFTTVGGWSPAGTRWLSSGRTGDMVGGYRTTLFTGVFEPRMPTSGFIGDYDYNCDTAAQCPGYVNWTSWYFPYGVTGFGIARWSYIYLSSGQYWTNSSTGSSGDIFG